MGIKDDFIEIKKEVEQMQEQSFVLELLKENNKKNKRQHVITIIILIMLTLSMTYNIFLLRNIGVSEETISIEDVETIDNSHIKIGDDIWEKSH